MVKVDYRAPGESNGQTKTIHFGAVGYSDYTNYYKTNKEEAEKRKNAYISRHKVNEDFNNPLTPAFWSRWILWNLPTIEASLKDTLKRFPTVKLQN